MAKKIVPILFIGLICSLFLISTWGFAVESGMTAKTGKAPAPTVKATMPAPSQLIKNVQGALNKEGFMLKVDGLMGKHTRAALKSYQKKNALHVTGKPDKATLAKLGIK
jgi:peptidoglycan hydrolase-like protein with peptidoglycan-binding domain